MGGPAGKPARDEPLGSLTLPYFGSSGSIFAVSLGRSAAIVMGAKGKKIGRAGIS
jgi:hypothetical protein